MVGGPSRMRRRLLCFTFVEELGKVGDVLFAPLLLFSPSVFGGGWAALSRGSGAGLRCVVVQQLHPLPGVPQPDALTQGLGVGGLSLSTFPGPVLVGVTHEHLGEGHQKLPGVVCAGVVGVCCVV